MTAADPLDAIVVVIGGGQAGGEVAASLRLAGHRGAITIVSDEDSYPYTRPPLSKGYLLGQTDRTELLLRDEQMYRTHAIEVRTGHRATSIDRRSRRVGLNDGTDLGYDALVLATGGRPRHLPHPELEGTINLHYLRTIDDVDRLRDGFTAGAHMLIVGGGYIGLEVASVSRRRGLEVTLIEACPRILSRVAAEPTSEFFTRIHREEGVDLRVDTRVAEYVLDVETDSIVEVVLTDGERLAVDLVLVGIGLIPNVELAETAGLAVENGILVDAGLRTSDPRVFAIGDVAHFPAADGSGLRRLESTPNAAEQARVAADNILGNARPYDAEPWFWSDQYDVKLQVTGLSTFSDETVVRGDPASGRSLSVFYLKAGALQAADIASNPKEFAAAKRLVASRVVVDPALLADPAVALRDVIATSPASA
jgi:3-phenylpropionate/trans-cinnamate dioxygenase ferredoxin reductase subunit